MPDYDIRLAGKEDMPAVLGLMRACFGERDFLSSAWYEWFNFRCPTGPNRNYVAVETGTARLVGGYGLLPIAVKVNDNVFGGSLCTNVMTHPEWQGRGLFTEMGRFCLSAESDYGSRVSLGVPNHNAVQGHMKVGWKKLAELVFVKKSSYRDGSSMAVEVSLFDSEIDELLEHASARLNFMVVKDHRFLNWRYAERPDKHYRLFVLRSGSGVDGYVVLKHFDDVRGLRKTHILDIIARDDRALDELLLAAETCSAGCEELNCWQVSHALYGEAFGRAGFDRATGGNTLIMHANYGQEVVPEPSSWCFVLGDNDVY